MSQDDIGTRRRHATLPVDLLIGGSVGTFGKYSQFSVGVVTSPLRLIH